MLAISTIIFIWFISFIFPSQRTARDLYFIKYPSKEWGTLLNTETDKSCIAKLIGITIDEKPDSDIVGNRDMEKLINYLNQADKKDPQTAINGPLTSINKMYGGSPLLPVSTPNPMSRPANYPIASSGESVHGMGSPMKVGSSPETEPIEMKSLTGNSIAMAKPVMSSTSPSAEITNSPSYDFGHNQWGNNWWNQNYPSGWNDRYKGYGTQALASQASKVEVPSPQNTKSTDEEASPKTQGMEHKSILKGADVKPKIIFDDYPTTNSSLNIASMKTNAPKLTETTSTEYLTTTNAPMEEIKINTETSTMPTTLFTQQPVQIIQYFFQQPFAPSGNNLASAVLPVDLPLC
ncbi:hypothetical protein ACOME3_005319 [Neoechinorhynchus agilis]